VLTLAFNADDTRLVTGGADQQLKVWDVKTRDQISTLGKHGTAINAVAWAPSGRGGRRDDAGELFRYNDFKSHTGGKFDSATERKFEGIDNALYCVAISANAERIFAGSCDGRVLGWNKDGKLVDKVDVNESNPHGRGLEMMRSPSGSSSADRRDALHRGAPRSRAKRDASNGDPAPLPRSVQSRREFRLRAGDRAHVMITARSSDGFEMDATDAATFTSPRTTRCSSRKRVDAGSASRTSDAECGIWQPAGGSAHRVIAAPADQPPSFVRDVLPVLSRAGCNAGSCHAKPDGQNGFRLSVFSFDPKSDYDQIVKNARGRRVFPSCPEESLLILKDGLSKGAIWPIHTGAPSMRTLIVRFQPSRSSNGRAYPTTCATAARFGAFDAMTSLVGSGFDAVGPITRTDRCVT
jgi:WD40 repeat protein